MATLFLLCGLPGAGKTTFAKQLEREASILRLTADDWIHRLLADATDKTELDRLRKPVETIQWELAKKLLSLEINVILDWGFWSRAEREAYRLQAEALEARVEMRFFSVERDELLERLAKRNADLQPGIFTVTEAELDRWIPWYEPPCADELRRCSI